jgi:acyl-coenzyme A synthetase/AMP-(fatty) acid ligase
MVYSFQSPEAIAKDIEELRLAVVVADREDWTPTVIDAARRTGSVGISLDSASGTIDHVPGLEALGEGPFGEAPEEPGLGILTSGTTGPPKRIHIRMPVLQRAAISASAQQAATAVEPPDLVFWPFSGIGVCQLIGVVYAGKIMMLLEKFDVPAWVDGIKRHRITRVGVQPVVIRMILDANVPKEDLASLSFVFGGSGPLEPETRQEFEHRYGIPVMWAYGATEFAGTLLAWSPDLYREFGTAKLASVGKPVPGADIRIVDPVTAAAVAQGEQGYLEARIPLIGPDWIRTTDIASVDEDGFVTLHGRGDGAINRGGFKILPETVQRTLVRHPAVLDATVVGVPDARLGAVPFAAVELVEGAQAPSEDELKAWVRAELPAHHVPPRIAIVEELPRLPSLKVSLEAVRALAPD